VSAQIIPFGPSSWKPEVRRRVDAWRAEREARLVYPPHPGTQARRHSSLRLAAWDIAFMALGGLLVVGALLLMWLGGGR
jgi:hypothetical protein